MTTKWIKRLKYLGLTVLARHVSTQKVSLRQTKILLGCKNRHSVLAASAVWGCAQIRAG